jgi:hypothetical protein
MEKCNFVPKGCFFEKFDKLTRCFFGLFSTSSAAGAWFSSPQPQPPVAAPRAIEKSLAKNPLCQVMSELRRERKKMRKKKKMMKKGYLLEAPLRWAVKE